jgi:hypothetical protein
MTCQSLSLLRATAADPAGSLTGSMSGGIVEVSAREPERLAVAHGDLDVIGIGEDPRSRHGVGALQRPCESQIAAEFLLQSGTGVLIGLIPRLVGRGMIEHQIELLAAYAAFHGIEHMRRGEVVHPHGKPVMDAFQERLERGPTCIRAGVTGDRERVVDRVERDALRAGIVDLRLGRATRCGDLRGDRDQRLAGKISFIGEDRSFHLRPGGRRDAGEKGGIRRAHLLKRIRFAHVDGEAPQRLGQPLVRRQVVALPVDRDDDGRLLGQPLPSGLISRANREDPRLGKFGHMCRNDLIDGAREFH